MCACSWSHSQILNCFMSLYHFNPLLALTPMPPQCHCPSGRSLRRAARAAEAHTLTMLHPALTPTITSPHWHRHTTLSHFIVSMSHFQTHSILFPHCHTGRPPCRPAWASAAHARASAAQAGAAHPPEQGGGGAASRPPGMCWGNPVYATIMQPCLSIYMKRRWSSAGRSPVMHWALHTCTQPALIQV